MGLGVFPSANWPRPDAELPTSIQIQGDGINLGGPDADTINFVGMTATRGAGERANVVTVEGGAGGGGGGGTGSGEAPTMFVILTGYGTFNDGDFSTWTQIGGEASAEAHWDAYRGTIVLDVPGLYECCVQGRVEGQSGRWAQDGFNTSWTNFGTHVQEAVFLDRSRYSRESSGQWNSGEDGFSQWFDKFLVDGRLGNGVITPKLYSHRYDGISADPATFTALVTVKRIG